MSIPIPVLQASGEDGTLDLGAVPTWALWALAIAAVGVFTGVLFRMMPPALRRGRPGASVLLGAAVFLLTAAVNGDPRGTLWFGAVGFPAVALPLLWMGKLPPDMPSAKDPAVLLHPRYEEVARRGRRAGIAVVVLVITAVALTVAFVRGV